MRLAFRVGEDSEGKRKVGGHRDRRTAQMYRIVVYKREDKDRCAIPPQAASTGRSALLKLANALSMISCLISKPT